MRCKGVVKGNVVLLEEGVHLPDGIQVMVTVAQEGQMDDAVTPEELGQRRELVTRMKAFGERIKDRRINLGDLIVEGREELEERA